LPEDETPSSDVSDPATDGDVLTETGAESSGSSSSSSYLDGEGSLIEKLFLFVEERVSGQIDEFYVARLKQLMLRLGSPKEESSLARFLDFPGTIPQPTVDSKQGNQTANSLVTSQTGIASPRRTELLKLKSLGDNDSKRKLQNFMQMSGTFY
jgi:hypothetical protein